MTTLDNNFYKALGMIAPGSVELLMKTEPDVDKVLAALPEIDQKVVAGLKKYDQFDPALIYAIKAIVDKQKETRNFCAGWSAAQERAKAAKKIVDKIKFAQTVYALEEDKDKTFKATISARDEELATFKAKIAECKEDIATLEATIAARDEEIMTTKGKLAVCEGQVDTKDNLLKFAKLELAACKEQLKAKDDLLKSKDEQLKLSMELVASKDELAKAKQASKGKPLACISIDSATPNRLTPRA